ncbi:MAG: FkbM family methyltransferase [Salinivirgaceae bacterium]
MTFSKIKPLIHPRFLQLLSGWYFKVRKLYYLFLLAPVNIRNDTSDIRAFEQVFLFKEYDLSFDFKPKIIIDAGANVGYASIYFSRLFKKAKIIAIEPELSNFTVLIENVKRYKNIICLQKGVWYKSAKLTISNPDDSKWSFRTVESESNSIEAVTIVGLMHEYAFNYIDVLKIDIEGAEKSLFKENYEDWLPKVRILIVEIHDYIDTKCRERVFNAISNYNFSHYCYGENTVFRNHDLV